MDKAFIHRVIVALYIILVLFVICLGFAYSNQESSRFRENFIEYESGWTQDGIDLVFPFESEEVFDMVNVLPQVYGDQYLIIKCYYEKLVVYVDEVEVFRTLDNNLFRASSDVGKKEAHIPMKEEYSGKTVRINIDLQDSLYGAEVYGCYISTRSGFAVYILKEHWVQFVVLIILMFSGICEVLIGIHFMLRRSLILRKLSFEAMVFSGFFSILSSVWILCQTRLLYVIYGNGTGFGVLEVVVFLMMPLTFFELVRAVNFRINFIDNIVDGVLATGILMMFILCIFGVFDWGEIVIAGHAIDIIVLALGSYYSYTSIKEEKRKSERRLIAFGNLFFLAVCLMGLAMYINNIDSDYNIIIVIGLTVYISTQVGVIFRRVGLRVEEEAELVQVKEFAYTDELTHLTNRRYFYEELRALKDKEPVKETTIVYFDVNRLKYYNDNMGHDAGDELLVGTAQCLRDAFSDSSTSIISRLGGDEFVVMLIAPRNDVDRRVELFKTLASKWRGKFIDGITVSIGVASMKDYPSADLEELCKHADDNMFEDKKNYYAKSGYERRNE